jgi:hypothetical protein
MEKDASGCTPKAARKAGTTLRQQSIKFILKFLRDFRRLCWDWERFTARINRAEPRWTAPQNLPCGTTDALILREPRLSMQCCPHFSVLSRENRAEKFFLSVRDLVLFLIQNVFMVMIKHLLILLNGDSAVSAPGE